MAGTLSLIWYLMRLQVRTRLEYRAGLLIAWVAQAFGYAGTYATIWVIVSRFEVIGDWEWPEIALMLGFHVLGYALGASFTFVQLRGMGELVRMGRFDALMVRPMNPWTYLVFSGINIEYGGHVLLGILLMTWSLPMLGIDWSMLTVLQLVLSLASAAMLTAAIFTAIGASALILGRSQHLFGLYFDFWELSRYPLTIFAVPVQVAMLTIVPLGFMAFVPVAALLGRPVPFFGPWAGVAAICAGPVAAALAGLFWRFCVRRYQGAGG